MRAALVRAGIVGELSDFEFALAGGAEHVDVELHEGFAVCESLFFRSDAKDGVAADEFACFDERAVGDDEFSGGC